MDATQPQSFYFFDFADNVMFLHTPILIKHAATGNVKGVSTAEFARIWPRLGAPGDWEQYAIFDGSYQFFRDIPADQLGDGKPQNFVSDIQHALSSRPPDSWQAPSWAFFVHACAKQRPLSIITARGHEPDTIKAGIRLLKDEGWIEKEPKYLTIFPVSNEAVRRALGDADATLTTPSLKKLAIIQSVEAGLELYGAGSPHQFGMSDDDPHNMQLIIEAMRDCKLNHPDKRFFVFNTHVHNSVKLEVLPIGMP